MSLTEWLNEEASPERKSISVCFDRRLVAELEGAEKALTELKRTRRVGEDAPVLADPDVDQAQARVEELREKVAERSHLLVFESIGRRKWRTLLGEHPPTDEQRSQDSRLDHNPETFVPAALAASCVEPGLSLEEAQRLIDEAPTVAMAEKIWVTCLTANVTGTKDPFVPASDGIRPAART